MKFLKWFFAVSLVVPGVSYAVSGDFQSASQLLISARRGDIQSVQRLINSGADVNYTDSNGLSLVCTAVMNNDTRAIQVLQMYGADASKCDRQIKKYKNKSKVAKYGEEYSFFSGLSSPQIIALSAVGVAAVIGGVAWLTDAFDAKNSNDKHTSGGSHSGGGGGSGGSTATATKWDAGNIPYGPKFLTSDGKIDTSFNVTAELGFWDNSNGSELRKSNFNYLRKDTANNFLSDGLNSMLQNYLLVMHGYNSFANGYMGQNIFREKDTWNPVLPAIEGAQMRPVRVALITGNGINPYGSANSGEGITYAISTASDSSTPLVDKYLNNNLSNNIESENSGYDYSGSGSAFNIFANVNDTALAKIVAGWEGGGDSSSTIGDLYGFVPNGQVAIYRTGNGTTWTTIETATDRPEVGTFTDTDNNGVLSATDVVKINGVYYTIYTADSQTAITQPILTINGTTYKLPDKSTTISKSIWDNLFVGKCGTDCDDIAIYIGTDGGWYVNSSGGDSIDAVYIADSGNVFEYKTKNTSSAHNNFTAIRDAVSKTYSVVGDPSATTTDIIANVNILDESRNINYLTTDLFTTMAKVNGATDLKLFYNSQITNYYGGEEGGIAHSLFNGYSSSLPMIIMPAGEHLYKTASDEYFAKTLDATFENYAPMLYGANLKHDFMTVVAVSHTIGTSSTSTISGYGDGIASSYGPLVLSKWIDTDTGNVYSSRQCGIAGKGSSANNIDPWCFAASGPTAEMATASAAGAVAAIKSAFSYMTNDQIFTLLALTADGPYLSANTSGTTFNNETLATHLKQMYELPLEYDVDNLSTTEYLEAFKNVFGYGLINLERAIKPGYAIYYYSKGNIVSSNGNQFWGNIASSSSSVSHRASSVLSLANHGGITTSFYDVVESIDGSLSLPRVWTNTLALDKDSKHGLYMGDVLGDFNVDSTNKRTNKVGNIEFSMAMSERAYNDNLNGLDNLKISWTNDKYDLTAEYQHYLTDGESRFGGRANGVLALASNTMASGAKYKNGKFGFGGRAFAGTITDEGSLDHDPVVSAQFEPGRLGFVNGGSLDFDYKNDKFAFGTSVGVIHEDNTILGMYSDGVFGMKGGNTKYIDAVATYKPMDKVKLSLRGTFADTSVEDTGLLISSLSDIKSNAFAFGLDIDKFSFTAAMPLAVVDGKLGYEYAQFDVVENDGGYDVVVNDARTKFMDLSAVKRELRFSTSYKKSVGEFTDMGIGFIYRVNPNNTDAFGNESLLMFKVHHRLGI